MQLHLDSYRRVARGETQPGYVAATLSRTGVVDIANLSIERLWELHNCQTRCDDSGATLLDVKIELARRLTGRCSLCERRCGKDRTNGELGFCGVGADSYYFFEQVLWGEEAPLVPSHEVFFSGCNLRCNYCYSWNSLLDTSHGAKVDPAELARLAARRKVEGAVNLNLIGGEPTVHLHTILQVLRHMSEPNAVVWNSNFYMSDETMRILDGVVDLYVGDFRFGNNRCALEIGGVDRYFETASRNFIAAAARGDVIIRHLLLPGHLDCCLRPVAEWVALNLPEVPFNLMFQYTPFHDALNDPELGRNLTRAEVAEARDMVRSFGLNTDGWNTPLGTATVDRRIGTGGIETTITVRPDGKVCVMHLHSDLIPIVRSLQDGGK